MEPKPSLPTSASSASVPTDAGADPPPVGVSGMGSDPEPALEAERAEARAQLNRCRRLVVKVGSSVLASLDGGIDEAVIAGLVADVAAQRAAGREVLLVSSGAVAAGCAALGWSRRPEDLPSVQAAAAVGQGALMEVYRRECARHGIHPGQVLITRDILEDRPRYLHARNALLAMLEQGILPVVNENDTVAVAELKLKLGDNDRIAVAVSHLVDADCVILLTDVPGLYDRPPWEADAAVIKHVEQLDESIRAGAGRSASGVGSGGMASKIDAAHASGFAAVPLVVGDGRRAGVIGRILAGAPEGTLFAPRERRRSSRQLWIAFGRAPEGAVVVDDGAARALVEGKKSLLAIGVRAVTGDFEEGATVLIQTTAGAEIGRGLCNFGAADLRAVAGRHSDDFPALLGCATCETTVVHKDNLLLTGGA